MIDETIILCIVIIIKIRNLIVSLLPWKIFYTHVHAARASTLVV